MSFYDRYMQGETREVYTEMAGLGEQAFSQFHLAEVRKVLEKTFARVSYNLEIIYNELVGIGYLFKSPVAFDFHRPLRKPLPGVDRQIAILTELVRPFGHIPLSLEYFYKIVGAVDFGWDYRVNENYF